MQTAEMGTCGGLARVIDHESPRRVLTLGCLASSPTGSPSRGAQRSVNTHR